MSPPTSSTESSSPKPQSTQTSASSSSSSSWTPKPIRILFSHFPLQTLPANRLPSRSISPASRKKNTLFLFTTASPNDKHAARIPSFNPSCLKWQAYLLVHGVEFSVCQSSNHASPSGSLPFLIPAEKTGSNNSAGTESTAKTREKTGPNTIVASSLQTWISSQKSLQEREKPDGQSSLQESAFLSLIDHRLRPAWLHSFYLTENLNTLAAQLYIHINTSSPLVRSWQTNQLHAAALVEVQKVYPLISKRPAEVDVLYAAAEKALEALDSALGNDEWFFKAQQPGLLDAAVFAYTCLILDHDLGQTVGGKWAGTDESRRLRASVEQFDRLRRHRDRILERYFS